MHVIEYEWRGLPYFHMAVRMKDVDTDSVKVSIDFADEFVRAELPRRENFLHLSDDQFTKNKESVKKCMIHTCANAIYGCKSKLYDI